MIHAELQFAYKLSLTIFTLHDSNNSKILTYSQLHPFVQQSPTVEFAQKAGFGHGKRAVGGLTSSASYVTEVIVPLVT